MNTIEAIKVVEALIIGRSVALGAVNDALKCAAEAEKNAASLVKQRAPLKGEITRLRGEHKKLVESLPGAIEKAEKEVSEIRVNGEAAADKFVVEHRADSEKFQAEVAEIKAKVADALKESEEQDARLKSETELLIKQRDKAERAWKATKDRITALVK